MILFQGFAIEVWVSPVADALGSVLLIFFSASGVWLAVTPTLSSAAMRAGATTWLGIPLTSVSPTSDKIAGRALKTLCALVFLAASLWVGLKMQGSGPIVRLLAGVVAGIIAAGLLFYDGAMLICIASWFRICPDVVKFRPPPRDTRAPDQVMREAVWQVIVFVVAVVVGAVLFGDPKHW